jgi:carbon storage regulator
MLTFGLKVGQEVVIGGNIRVRVLATQPGRARLGVQAPADVLIDRGERRREAPGGPPGAGPAGEGS